MSRSTPQPWYRVVRPVPELGFAVGDHLVLRTSAPPLAVSSGRDIVRRYRYTASGVRRDRPLFAWDAAVWRRIRVDGTLVRDDPAT